MQYLSIKYQTYWKERRDCQSFTNASFCSIDSALYRAYFFQNSYRISRKYLQRKRTKNPYQYGETLLQTMYQIGRRVNITDKDHVMELGAGRGRVCFFIQQYFGCKVTGIEQIPVFVKKAKKIAKKFSLPIEFYCEDFLTTDFSSASVIYLYGTCLEEEMICELCKKIPRDIKVISVSYPLCAYSKKS